MRNISFALTTQQVRQREKRVTRRAGKSWLKLKPGDLLCAVEKGQGLKKGEKINRLAVIRIVSVRREPLNRMVEDQSYGRMELTLEGFGCHRTINTPEAFVRFFMATHGCLATDEVTRIEFAYEPGLPDTRTGKERRKAERRADVNSATPEVETTSAGTR